MFQRNFIIFSLWLTAFLIFSPSAKATMCGLNNNGSCQISCNASQSAISDPTNKCTGTLNGSGGTICCSPANIQEYPASQCTAMGGGNSSNAADCGLMGSGWYAAGKYLRADCSDGGFCCVPSGTTYQPAQACITSSCESSTPGARCLVSCEGGETPSTAGTCSDGKTCCIPGGGGICQNMGGVCIEGLCSSENRSPNTGGSCVGADAGKTCCTTATSATLARGAFSYTLLEEIPNSSGTSGDFASYLQALYKFTFWAIGIAALFMLTVGGFMYITSAGNTSRISTAKTVIVDSILGIIIALFAWLFLYVLNPDLVEGLALPTTTPVVVTGEATTGGTGGTSTGTGGAACSDPDALKAGLASGGSICSGQCNRQLCSFSSAVNSAIDQVVAQNPGVDKRVIKAIICKESGGNPNAHSFDGGCGLMQITNSAWVSSCPASILDPVENIRQGVMLYKQKLSAVSGLNYGGNITTTQMASAAYNCCGNGDNPNSQSVSCATSNGWASIPKWACPIDPGTGTFNMCTVKNYACEIEACALRY